ncbi:MAG: hypothetical protein M1825_004718 [Sarcosagium campestre]|nr:MAG: hypothetical protein M1825_004718 [Sarcosagium campestre]
MPLYYTAAHSSRIQKSRSKDRIRRTASSPFGSLPQRKAISRTASKASDAGHDNVFDDEERLNDVGLISALATDLSLRDVAQSIRYIRSHMFDEIPERGSGMSSVRIAEILTFRQYLPPIATVNHVQALLSNPTHTEREIMELVRRGTVKKLVVPNRGDGGCIAADVLVLTEDWEHLIRHSESLGNDYSERFLSIVRQNLLRRRFSSSMFSEDEIRALMHAGFLTVFDPSLQQTPTAAFSRPSRSSSSPLNSISFAGSTAPSGSVAASGGPLGVHEVGGSGGGNSALRRGVGILFSADARSSSQNHLQRSSSDGGGDVQMSLPRMGSYLRLLDSARAHLASLLSKSKNHEAPLSLLQERWDGGVPLTDNAVADPRPKSTHRRGAAAGRTRKWKHLYGLKFEWALGECVGAGAVELFETGSIGRAARLL